MDRRYVEIHAAAQAVVAEVLGVPFEAAGLVSVEGVDVAFLQLGPSPEEGDEDGKAATRAATAILCGCYARATLADQRVADESDVEQLKKHIWESYLQNERQAMDVLSQSPLTAQDVKARLAEANRLGRKTVDERWLEIRAIALVMRHRTPVVTPADVRAVIKRLEAAMAESGHGRDDEWLIGVAVPPDDAD